MSHPTPDTPPSPKRDGKIRRKLSWGIAIFVTMTNVIAQIRGDPDRFILSSLAALCIIFCLSADRLNATKEIEHG